MTIVFYVFAAMAIIFALFILFSKNILHSAFALVVVFFAIAGMYVLLGAPFVGVTQILVYIGGVIVFIVFGVMLTNRFKGRNLISELHNRFWGYILAVILFGALTIFYTTIDFEKFLQQASPVEDDVRLIGVQLMSEYLIPFELVGVLLLLALIGAVAIAGNKKAVET